MSNSDLASEAEEEPIDENVIKLIENKEALNKRLKQIDKDFIHGDESDEEDDEAENENIFLERNKLLEEKYEQKETLRGLQLLERMGLQVTTFQQANYYIFYNGIVEAFVVNPALMAVPIDDKMVLNSHCITKVIYIYDGKIFNLRKTIDALRKEAAEIFICSSYSDEEIENIVAYMFSYTQQLNGVEVVLWLTSGCGTRALRPDSEYVPYLQCYEGTLYALCMRSVRRDTEKQGMRVKTDTEWLRSKETFSNNNLLYDVYWHLRSQTEGYDDTILFEIIDGVEYVSSIRMKNIFVIIDFKAYKNIEYSLKLEELKLLPDGKDKNKNIKKIQIENYQIADEEPPLLMYPKNFPLDEYATRCLEIADTKLKTYGTITDIIQKLITRQDLMLAKEIIMIDGEFLYNVYSVDDKIIMKDGSSLVNDNLDNMLYSKKLKSYKDKTIVSYNTRKMNM